MKVVQAVSEWWQVVVFALIDYRYSLVDNKKDETLSMYSDTFNVGWISKRSCVSLLSRNITKTLCLTIV